MQEKVMLKQKGAAAHLTIQPKQRQSEMEHTEIENQFEDLIERKLTKPLAAKCARAIILCREIEQEVSCDQTRKDHLGRIFQEVE